MFSKHMFIERAPIKLMINVEETSPSVYRLTYYANDGTRAKRALQMVDTIDCAYRRQLSEEEQNTYRSDDSFRMNINTDLVVVGRIEIYAIKDVVPVIDDDTDAADRDCADYIKIKLDACIFPTKLFNTASRDLCIGMPTNVDLYMSFPLAIDGVIYNVMLTKLDTIVRVSMLMHGARLGLVGYTGTRKRAAIELGWRTRDAYWMNELAETDDNRLICYGFSVRQYNGFMTCDRIYEEDITDMLPAGCKIYDLTNYNCSSRPNLVILCDSQYTFPTFYMIDPVIGASDARPLNKEMAELIVSFKWYCQAKVLDEHCETDSAEMYGADTMLACRLDGGRIMYNVIDPESSSDLFAA